VRTNGLVHLHVVTVTQAALRVIAQQHLVRMSVKSNDRRHAGHHLSSGLSGYPSDPLAAGQAHGYPAKTESWPTAS
jgi:hypothetical protein